MKAFHRIPSRSERPSPMVPTLHIFKPWTGHGMSTELLGQQTSLCILELDRLHDMQASVQQLAPTINLFQNIQRHEMLEVSLHFSLHLSHCTSRRTQLFLTSQVGNSASTVLQLVLNNSGNGSWLRLTSLRPHSHPFRRLQYHLPVNTDLWWF